MTDDLEIRWCAEDEIDVLEHYIDTRWRRDHILSRDRELLRWQFDPRRMGGEHRGPSVLLGWLGDEIAGMLAVTGFDLNLLGERTPAVWIELWCASPEHRRRNVALKLLRKVREAGYDAVWGLGLTPDGRRVLRALQFEILEELPRWVGVFDRERSTSLIATVQDVRMPAARALCDLHAVRVAEAPSGVVGWTDTVALEWDECWARLAPGLVGAARDSSYLRWRYFEHPEFDYQIRFVRSAAGKVSGLAVCRIEDVPEYNDRVMRIVELLAEDGGREPLVRHLVEEAERVGVVFADFYCSSAREGEVLESCGFRREVRSAHGLVFPSRMQPLEPGVSTISGAFLFPHGWRGRLNELVESGRLYVTKSDADQDRPN